MQITLMIITEENLLKYSMKYQLYYNNIQIVSNLCVSKKLKTSLDVLEQKVNIKKHEFIDNEKLKDFKEISTVAPNCMSCGQRRCVEHCDSNCKNPDHLRCEWCIRHRMRPCDIEKRIKKEEKTKYERIKNDWVIG